MSQTPNEISLWQRQWRGSLLQGFGSPRLLEAPLLGVVCSQRCPADLILKAYDATRQLREAGQAVICGFHTPIEQDLLPILLRGSQSVVWCLARSAVGMRISTTLHGALREERLTIVSPFVKPQVRRITRTSALQRNRWLGVVSSAVLVIHARPQGALEDLCRTWLAEKRPVYALPGDCNQPLFDLGVKEWFF